MGKKLTIQSPSIVATLKKVLYLPVLMQKVALICMRILSWCTLITIATL